MTVSEQVAPVLKALLNDDPADLDTWGLAAGIECMAAEIDALRARLQFIAVSGLMLAISVGTAIVART